MSEPSLPSSTDEVISISTETSKQNTETQDIISSSSTTKSSQECTIDEKDVAQSENKVVTKISDYFSKKRGRKKIFGSKRKNKKHKKGNGSDTVAKRNNSLVGEETKDDSELSDSDTSGSLKAARPSTTEKKTINIKWSDPENFHILAKAIEAKRRLGKLYKHAPLSNDGLFVPRTTLITVMKRLGDLPVTIGNCFPLQKNALLSNQDRDVLQDIICRRDQTNEGVSRKEAIGIISDIAQAKSHKQAANHLDYLIRTEKLTNLKRNGRIVTAQATTTERSQINVAQQLHWHYHIDSEWQ